MKLNQIAHLQTEVIHSYMRKYNLTPAEFVNLDRKYNVIRFIEEGYIPFHLTGIDGVLDEVDEFIRIQHESSAVAESSGTYSL